LILTGLVARARPLAPPQPGVAVLAA